MQFDDRLDTVLRRSATGDPARRTQYRQLIDLLGRAHDGEDTPARAAAYERLDSLSAALLPAERAQILRGAAVRITSPRLATYLADQDDVIAAAAMARSDMREGDWLDLIPMLPIAARGYLRHRDDLPNTAVSLLRRLGVHDLVLPQPDAAPLPGSAQNEADAGHLDDSIQSPEPEAEPIELTQVAQETEIGALVQRIEAFQRARRSPANDGTPRLPLNDNAAARSLVATIDFCADASGVVTWATQESAPMLVGLDMHDLAIGPAMERRANISAGLVELTGAAAIAGTWRADAAPAFHPATGSYAGYRGRLRRVEAPSIAPQEQIAPADRIRQLLHELRTPVNAIQGFAEVIQQQIFGPSPNEYRALAANIAADAARILAGFEELDRLARLETDALDLMASNTADGTDIAALLIRTVEQVETTLAARNARIDYHRIADTADGARVSLSRDDADRLVWRLIASMGSALAPGEAIALHRTLDNAQFILSCDLPAKFHDNADLFSARAKPASGPLSPGLFGTGFALRLVRAEARAIGGDLVRSDHTLMLTLPVLTAPGAGNSEDADQATVA